MSNQLCSVHDFAVWHVYRVYWRALFTYLTFIAWGQFEGDK